MATRRLTVITTTVVKTGVSTNGKPWQLREVVAVGEDGSPIEEKLKTFDELEGTVEVEIERVEHEKYGVSYMLKLPKGSEGAAPAPSAGARLGPKVDELRDRIEKLERELAAVTATVTTLVERANAPAGASANATPLPRPAAEEATF